MSNPPKRKALIGASIFDGSAFIEDAALLIECGRVCDIVEIAKVEGSADCIKVGPGMLVPGFIDIQVNGGGGALFNNSPDTDTLLRIVKAHRRRGTTALMPTLISDHIELWPKAVEAISSFVQNHEAGILGIHLEGPHFSERYRGVHQADFFRRLDLSQADAVKALQARIPELNLLLTFAPERAELAAITALAEAGVLLNGGHSEASYEETLSAIEAGLQGFTHLFNAMCPLQSRAPGIIGAALTQDSCYASIIADGHHLHAATLKLAQRIKPRGKLFFVSDSMATAGSSQKSFSLYEEKITLENDTLVNSEGKLAGSNITLIDAIRYATQSANIDLAEAINMASRYPATFLGIDKEHGQIKAGARADLVLLDAHLNVNQVWIAGEEYPMADKS